MGWLNYLIGAGGFAAGLALAAGGYWAYDGLIDDPAVRQDQQQICEVTYSSIAATAAALERKRQQDIIDDLTRRFNIQIAQRQKEQVEATRELEHEIAEYEAMAAADPGGVCAVTDDNLDFLQPRSR